MSMVNEDRLSLKQLKSVPLLANLSDAECRELAGAASVLEFDDGAYVLRQGRQDQSMWIVLEGQCEVVRQIGAETAGAEEVVLAVLDPHASFGEMSFFQPAPHSASVRAKGVLRLMRIERADYGRLVEAGCWSAYKLAFNTVVGLADRLRRMDEWVSELVTQESAVARTTEWSSFRDKLFGEWNL